MKSIYRDLLCALFRCRGAKMEWWWTASVFVCI